MDSLERARILVEESAERVEHLVTEIDTLKTRTAKLYFLLGVIAGSTITAVMFYIFS